MLIPLSKKYSFAFRIENVAKDYTDEKYVLGFGLSFCREVIHFNNSYVAYKLELVLLNFIIGFAIFKMLAATALRGAGRGKG